MTHYTNTDNPIDFPKKKKIPMLERFAAQSLVELDGELIFSKEKFAELIVRECVQVGGPEDSYTDEWFKAKADSVQKIKQHFGVEE
jgi:hypothetical protein